MSSFGPLVPIVAAIVALLVGAVAGGFGSPTRSAPAPSVPVVRPAPSSPPSSPPPSSKPPTSKPPSSKPTPQPSPAPKPSPTAPPTTPAKPTTPVKPTTPTPPATSTATLVRPLTVPRGPVGADRAEGVDVSVYDHHIDWPTVKGAGIVFAIARATLGVGYDDPEFAHNWSETKRLGIVRGAYHYYEPTEDPVAQADHFCAVVGALGAGDLPPAVDYEKDSKLTAAEIAQGLLAFIDRVKQRTGVAPMIYADPSHWSGVADHAAFALDDAWIAHWNVAAPFVSTPWHDWMFWQYTSGKKAVAGIPASAVDHDVFNGSPEDLRAYAGAPVTKDFFRGIAASAQGHGVWTVTLDGGVLPYGEATFYGTLGGRQHAEPFLGIVRSATGEGYWAFRADGVVSAFGDAQHLGDLSGKKLTAPIVAMAATPSGRGYWLLDQDGAVTGFGDAGGHGDSPVTGRAVALAATPSGQGYWIATADGEVLKHGDAVDVGTHPTLALTSPVVGMAATPSGQGCWLAQEDGSVLERGDAPKLAPAVGLRSSVLAIAPTLTGKGYWLLEGDGSIHAAGDAAKLAPRPR